MRLFQVHVVTLNELQAVFAPGMALREREGMNVRVADHVAPLGGPSIPKKLEKILVMANTSADPWDIHVAFETLHPYLDGNGRTGRMLWAWQMQVQGWDPFALSFLHRWYYQTLSASRERAGRS